MGISYSNATNPKSYSKGNKLVYVYLQDKHTFVLMTSWHTAIWRRKATKFGQMSSIAELGTSEKLKSYLLKQNYINYKFVNFIIQ